MINAVQLIDCDTCYGKGLVFIGDDNDYNVEPCECVSDWAIQHAREIRITNNYNSNYGCWCSPSRIIMAGYSQEQLQRKAWLAKHGSFAGYHKATEQERKEVLDETNNNQHERHNPQHGFAY